MSEPITVDAIDTHFTPARADDVYTVLLDGEAVLLDEGENRLHLLNHTATLAWQLFDGEATLDELATDVSAELDVGHDVVLADLLTITCHLGDEGLLVGVARKPEPGCPD
jgi:hypothetical protein